MFSRAGVAVVSIESGDGTKRHDPTRSTAREELARARRSLPGRVLRGARLHPPRRRHSRCSTSTARANASDSSACSSEWARRWRCARSDTMTSLTVRSLAVDAPPRSTPRRSRRSTRCRYWSSPPRRPKVVSSFRDVGELRVKESDRFEGSLALATKLGCRAWSEGDDLFVEGLGSASAVRALRHRRGARSPHGDGECRRRLRRRGLLDRRGRHRRVELSRTSSMTSNDSRERSRHRHRRSGRLGEVHRRARRRGAARLVLPRHRRDVPRGDVGGPALAASTYTTRRPSRPWPQA